jgi:rhomboid protease GluP
VAEARKSAPKVRTALEATAPAVRTIMAIVIGVFVLQMVTGMGGGRVTEMLLMDPFAIAAGEWWRLLTPVLVHGSLLHVGLNMYIFYIYGPNVEQAFGTLRFVAIFLITGFLASAFSYALPPLNRSVGASGAVFGVVGVLIVYLYKRRRSTFMAQYLRGMGLFIGINILFGFIVPGIDNMAHLGGLIGGALLGLGFDRGEGAEARSPVGLQVLTAAAVVALGLVLVYVV